MSEWGCKWEENLHRILFTITVKKWKNQRNLTEHKVYVWLENLVTENLDKNFPVMHVRYHR